MTNALVLEKEKFGYKKRKQSNNPLGNELKRIGNDSLFYFAIFLAALFVMQYIPVISGLVGKVNIGINEVAVSVLGFVNIFFVQLYNKILKKK